MNLKNLLFLTLLISTQLLFANGDPVKKKKTDDAESFCVGTEKTWKAYELNRSLLANEYEVVEKTFTPFVEDFVNNTTGAWSSVIPMPLVPVAAANLPDGKLMTWSAKDKLSFGGNLGRTWTAIFDPLTNTAQDVLVQNTAHDMFCPGTNTLPDGRILVAGGSSSNKTSLYDPATGQWSAGDEMNISRGYHANVTLASGATFLVGGSWSGGQGGKDAEVWTSKSSWFTLPGVPVEAITDGINAPQATAKNDYFPWLWVAPNGKLLHAGPSPKMHWIDPNGVGGYTDAGLRGNDTYAISGTTVMYDVGKVLKTGGSNTFEENTTASGRTYIIDMNSDNVQVTQTDNLTFPRVFNSMVVLPNGEVMAIGGLPIADAFSDQNSILTPELWNPNTQQWTSLAPMSVPRNYHSISILMTDGRVYTGGGGLCGSCSTNHPDAQIYSPPYLFNANGSLATRPVINNAPNTVAYNSNIQVNTNAAIGAFSLVKMSSTTHSTNNEQRRIPVSATALGGNQYQLAIPNRNILPPGQYMLFAMNNAGTPSLAKIIKIGDDIHSNTTLAGANLGGSGLSASYFNNMNFTGLALEREDAQINFNWGTGAPDASMGVNTFSVRWEGQIEVPREGGYTFYTNSDDGVRLWINNKLMVDNWTDHAPTEDIGMIDLLAGQRYDIKIEYYENAGGALAQLRWSGPGINKELVPTQYLFPINDCQQVGDVCNDGNACTTNDIYDADCNCVGTFQDSDGDGVCNADDVCPNLDDNLIGTACNDGNPNTTNDIYLANCSCAGTPVSGGDPDCNDITVTPGNGLLTVGGLDGAPITAIQIFTSNWQGVYNCFGDCGTPTANINLADGDYIVYVKYFSASYNFICQVDGTYTVGGGGGCTDADNDGYCQADDCNDNNPAIPANPGSTCNDGNANTTNDVIQADGCSCAGTPIGGGGDPCVDLSIVAANGTITINGLDGAPISHLQVFTSSWQPQYSCAGNCDPTETVSLPNGNYIILVKFYNANWTPVCETNQTVSLTGGGGNNDPCLNQGGDSDGDGICDNNDNCPNDANPGQADSDNDGIGDVCDTPTTGGGDCDDISFSVSGGNLSVSGLDGSPVSMLQVYDPQWQQVFKCSGNCNGTETIAGIGAGNYYVIATLFDASWTKICEKDANVSNGQVQGLTAQQGTELFQFTAKKEGRAVSLVWITNTEAINESFVLERSSDGINFEQWNQVESLSEENSHTYYNELDKTPVEGRNYYRVKKIHKDGSVQYSNVADVVFDLDIVRFSIFPNPANEQVYINLPEYVGRTGRISIANALGQQLVERQFTALPDSPIECSTKALKAGIYTVHVHVEGTRKRTKLLVIAKQ
ncbi:MAG: PA14 domain-containing protein [Saprospiraceae bacterium]